MRLVYLLIPALALFSSHQTIAQGSYPDRPIKMIVPLAAASAVDVAARIVTQKMADNIGQQIVILNQPGASGLIGATPWTIWLMCLADRPARRDRSA